MLNINIATQTATALGGIASGATVIWQSIKQWGINILA